MFGEKNMTVICFDISLSNTGIAVFDDNGQCKELTSIGTLKDITYPLKLKHIERVMKSIKRKYKPSVIVIEESFTRFNKSTQAIYRVRGITELIFYDIEQNYYHATTVRKKVLGKGNAKKEELRNFILENYKDVKFDDLDQSDAFGLGLCYFKMKGVI
jgi:crossover junction endodeoxyribonuclease RuvC